MSADQATDCNAGAPDVAVNTDDLIVRVPTARLAIHGRLIAEGSLPESGFFMIAIPAITFRPAYVVNCAVKSRVQSLLELRGIPVKPLILRAGRITGPLYRLQLWADGPTRSDAVHQNAGLLPWMFY